MRHLPGDDIGVFLSVCDAGSFAAAAATLHLSPSAVAKAVARIERRLNSVLFHRTTRRLALTREGAIYRDAARSARDALARAEQMLANLSSEPSGTVRVSLPPLLGTRVIAPALFNLTRTWPFLRYVISGSTQAADLFADNVDIAVRIGVLPDLAGVTARALGTQNIVLCGSAEYLALHGVPTSIEALNTHQLIAAPYQGEAAPWMIRQHDGTVHAYQPDARFILDGSMLTLAAVEAGQGLGVLPRWLVADAIAIGTIMPVMEEAVVGHLPVHVLWPSSPAMLPRMRVTIDAIVAATRAVLA